MSYTDFKAALFIAMAHVAEVSSRGQVSMFPVADGVLPDVKEQWVYDAVASYENAGLVFNVSRALGPPREEGGGIVLMMTGRGREEAESLKEKSSKKIIIEAGQAGRTNIIPG